MKISRQLYEGIADTIGCIEDDEKRSLQTSWWCEFFEKQTSHFDREKFLDYIDKSRSWHIQHRRTQRIKIYYA